MRLFLKSVGCLFLVAVLSCLNGYSGPKDVLENTAPETGGRPRVNEAPLPIKKNLSAGSLAIVRKDSSGKLSSVEIKNAKGEVVKTATRVSDNMWHFKGDGEEGFLTQTGTKTAYFVGATPSGSPIDLKFSIDVGSGDVRTTDATGVIVVYTAKQAIDGASEPGIAGVVGLTHTVLVGAVSSS